MFWFKKPSVVPVVSYLKGSIKYQMKLCTTRTGIYKKTEITLISSATIHIMEAQQRGKILSEHRFRKVLFILRLAGIPLNMHTVPRLYTAYNGTIITCFYFTYFACLMDLIFSDGNLVGAMKTIRIIIGMQFGVWIHIFFR
jgi:hypothetical protein